MQNCVRVSSIYDSCQREILKHEIQFSPIKPHFDFFLGQMGFSGVVTPLISTDSKT